MNQVAYKNISVFFCRIRQKTKSAHSIFLGQICVNDFQIYFGMLQNKLRVTVYLKSREGKSSPCTTFAAASPPFFEPGITFF